MALKKLHIALLFVSVVFLLAHSAVPHYHMSDTGAFRYTRPDVGNMLTLIQRTLSSDLGEEHFQNILVTSCGMERSDVDSSAVDYLDTSPVSVVFDSDCLDKSDDPGRRVFFRFMVGTRALRAPPQA